MCPIISGFEPDDQMEKSLLLRGGHTAAVLLTEIIYL